jgi:hypothetical protein
MLAAMIGRLGADALSAFTLARTVYHITGMSLVRLGKGKGLEFVGRGV